ncbi:MAG: uroporphyrinogen-III synthase [Actinomycetales bacterium]
MTRGALTETDRDAGRDLGRDAVSDVTSGPAPAAAPAAPTVPAAAKKSTGAARASAGKKPAVLGTVTFVGTGPGDPALLTLRAVELLQQADVVVLDSAAGRRLAERYAPDAELVTADFDAHGSRLTQAGRAKLVASSAKGGKRVVRLMDGDPTVYNGLVEELEAVRKGGGSFELVPGVSSVTAVPAYAGVPVTTHGTAGLVVLDVDAHVTPTWESFVADALCVVLLGGAENVAVALKELSAAGRSGSTPVVVTAGGTTTAQRSVVATLEDASDAVTRERFDAPVVAVLGQQVSRRDDFSWYESKPLFGWHVLVPRTKEQAGAVSLALRERGAVAEEVPTISVEPPRTPHQMDKAIRGLVEGRYEWVAFTSVNALKAVREKFREYGLDARAFSGLKVAAVGEKTADALRAWGIEPDLVPSGEQSAQGLLADWPPFDPVLDPINRVFLPRADIATETLVAGLVELGWEADDVTAYRTVRAAPPAAEVREAIKSGGFDAVLFTSSSTVRNLVGIAGKPHPSTVVACIGPQTAKTAEEAGLRGDVLAAAPSVEALVTALAEYGEAHRAAALASGSPVLRPSERRGPARRRAR